MSPSGVSAIPDTQPGSVNILERAILLNETLDYLLQAKGLGGFSRSSQVAERIGENTPQAQQGAAEKANQLRVAAKNPFNKAFGLQKILDNPDGLWSEQRAKREASNALGDFSIGKGREAKTTKTPAEIRRELASTITVQSTMAKGENSTPAEPAAPHEVSAPIAATKLPEAEQPGLSTREKLIVLAEAQDAGFLPTTNEEKNMVMTYLDYIKNPDFELRTQSQLIEVGNFHGRHHDFSTAKEFALQAGQSIAFEFADWFTQATQQLAELMEVRQLIHEIDNPDLSLALALHVDMQKAVPLIRYMDLATLRAEGKVEYQTGKGKISPSFVLLRTRRNEKDIQIPGKNKTLEDPYTGKRTDTATKWLKTRMTQIKVGNVRQIIEEAIVDQENRVKFHKLVLTDLALEKTDSEMLGEASKVAQQVLLEASQV